MHIDAAPFILAIHHADTAGCGFYNRVAGRQNTGPRGQKTHGTSFSALLARPVSIQIWALRSRLEKQPTDLRRNQRDLGDGALARPRLGPARFKDLKVALGAASIG